MHILDSRIADIEGRLEDIFTECPQTAASSVQESLSAYGWMILDCWVAWKTLRFLLRETIISPSVNDKWFQTPSSYKASQLKAIWFWNEDTESYIQNKFGKGTAHLFDQIIQPKRNKIAHFSGKDKIEGSEWQEVQNIYEKLTVMFRILELRTFLLKMCSLLEKRGFGHFVVIDSAEIEHSVNEFEASIDAYAKESFFRFCFMSEENDEYDILFDKSGNRISVKMHDGRDFSFVADCENKPYSFISGSYYDHCIIAEGFIERFLKQVSEAEIDRSL